MLLMMSMSSMNEEENAVSLFLLGAIKQYCCSGGR
jgi:hypothetical protein